MKKTIILATLLSMALIASNAFAYHQKQGKQSQHGGQYSCSNPANHARGKNTEGQHGMKQGHGLHGKQFHGKQHRHWQKLTQEQRDQLKMRHQQFIDETVSQRTAIANLYNEMQMVMETSAPDRNKLVALIKQIEPLKMEMAIKRVDLQLRAKEIAPELPHAVFIGKKGHGQKQQRCFPKWNENNPYQADPPETTE